MNIRLHVEHILLEGLPVRPGDRSRIERALVSELTEMLSASALADALPTALAQGSAVAALAAPTLLVSRTDSASAIGEGIAKSAFQSLGTHGETIAPATASHGAASPGSRQ